MSTARIDPSDLEPGMQLTPTLELVERLGEGGMGSVWVAFDKKLERQVAVKVISAALLSSADSLRRFQREARIAARVHNPHVVHMFDFGLLDDRVPYLVMELLKGEGLDARLDREGVLTPPSCALLVDQVAQALRAAHDAGIIHRDIKPANVFLVDSAYELFVKIVDFGIAKPTKVGDTTAVTMAGMLVGTPTYMSPEQLLDAQEPSPHTDMWGLSVVAYECVTGYLPFDAGTVAALGGVLSRGEFIPPSAHRDDLPAALDDFFLRAFERNPRKRFEDPIALANAFIDAAGGLPARSSHRHADRTPRIGSLGDAPTLTPSTEFPARPSREMSPGRLGKYQLVAELGHGGMADVYLAVAQGPAGFGFSKLMVIKRLRPSLANDSEFVSMIVDEARLAARLNHPNVVQTLEVGRVGKHYFIAMEYLEGQPLDRLLNRAHRRDGGIRKDLGYLVVSDMLAGLHHAHSLRDYDGEPLNVVHRDVSPHNVFITYDGQVKVVDFGIARAAKRATHTATGVVKGKLFYMAPEQARGDALDRRADIFSAGILLWEIAAGRRMWDDTDDVVVMHKLTSGGYPSSPKEVVAEVPEAIDAICKKALARDPDDRYPTAAAMQADLDRVIHEMRAQMAHGNASHELGEYVAELFDDDRQEIQGKIERQMKALAEATHPELIEAVQISRKITPSADQEAPTELHDAADAESSHSSDAPMTATPGLSSSNRRLWFGAAAAVIVVGGIALAFNKDDAQPQAPVQPSAAPANAGEAPQPSSPQQETVRVRVSVTPSDAVVTLDGKRLDGNPFDARMDRDDRTHTLTVEAPGHKTESRTISLARDVDLDIELRSISSRTARTAKTPGPQPATQPSPKGVGVKTTRTIDTSDPYGGKPPPKD